MRTAGAFGLSYIMYLWRPKNLKKKAPKIKFQNYTKYYLSKEEKNLDN